MDEQNTYALRQALKYWRYAEIINEELGSASRYVEPVEENFSTYSLEFAKILLASCAEVEAVAKLLCGIINPNSRIDEQDANVNMKAISKVIVSRFPEINHAKATIVSTEIDIFPFDVWVSENIKAPSWWLAYDKIKHERHHYFSYATYKNAIDSTAAMLILNCYLYKLWVNETPPYFIRHGLLDLDYTATNIVYGATAALPGL